jgi:hypothetical protein
MKSTILFLLSCVVCAAATFGYSNPRSSTNWSDTTRDVYVDNELDHAVQVLTADTPSRLALISSKLDSALVLNVSDHTVSKAPKESFQFATDHMSAICESDAGMKVIGKFTRIDGPIYFFVVDGKPVLVRAHPGATGELTKDKLWETVPVWHSVMANYVPNAQAVSTIKSNDKDTTVTLAFGTWCPDSKNYIPRLIKALEASANSKIQLKLVGIDNQFREPVSFVQPHRITNVPTVIVERGGREIGRIVETPAASTIEEDLAAILTGKQPIHSGRWDRGPKLASGVYSYRGPGGKEVGTESWEMFSTSEGGFLIHSRITTSDLNTEVFYRVDAKRRPTFAEITKTRLDDTTRTRYTIENNTLTARMRGNVTGVVSQTLEIPERLFFCSPAIASRGIIQGPEADRYQISDYLAPQDFETAMGALTTTNCESKGEEELTVTSGKFHARHVMRKTNNETSEWWLESKLGIPLKGHSSNLDYILTSIDINKR